ncbi:MAG: hypothetical protein OJF47_003298 [Nitrospira sp.]|jgi:hypothetical protein|nr:MAG: hypothetical protein OJF47_003298 [Nitrospira sp.]
MTESAWGIMLKKGVIKNFLDRMGSDLPIAVSLLASILMVLGALLRASFR